MQAARAAEAKQLVAEQQKDDDEATANRTLASYCWMMSERALRGIFDEPDTHTAYYSFDERIGMHGQAAQQAKTFDEIDAEVSGEVVADDEPKQKTIRDVALNGAMATLTPREHEVANLYYGGNVRRKDAKDMSGGIKIMTFDTHTRNITAKRRRVQDVAAKAF